MHIFTHFDTFTLPSVSLQNVACSKSHLNCKWLHNFKHSFPKTGVEGRSTCQCSRDEQCASSVRHQHYEAQISSELLSVSTQIQFARQILVRNIDTSFISNQGNSFRKRDTFSLLSVHWTPFTQRTCRLADIYCLHTNSRLQSGTSVGGVLVVLPFALNHKTQMWSSKFVHP
jgi:hypothetical protein